MDTQFFEWFAAKLDRLLLSGEESDELLKDVPMLVNLLLGHDKQVRKVSDLSGCGELVRPFNTLFLVFFRNKTGRGEGREGEREREREGERERERERESGTFTQ